MDWVWGEFGLFFLNVAAFKGGKLLRVVGMASKGKRRCVFISTCIFKYLEGTSQQFVCLIGAGISHVDARKCLESCSRHFTSNVEPFS